MGARGPCWRLWALPIVLACLVCGPGFSRAGQIKEFPEYQLKAAFLYNFCKFITWPPRAFSSPDRALTIGIVGENPFGPLLQDLVADKKVGGRSLAVRQFKRDELLEGCHILFISRSEKDRVPALLAAVRGKSVLTVSEMDGFAQHGGMINLMVVGDSIRFEINPEEAEKADLRISSKLGTLGTVVKNEETQKN